MCHFFENNDIVQNAELIKHRTNLYHVFYRWNQRQHKSIEKNCGEPLWDTKRDFGMQIQNIGLVTNCSQIRCNLKSNGTHLNTIYIYLESLQLRANLDKILNKYLNKNKINYKNHTM
jgi:hypothetical protein